MLVRLAELLPADGDQKLYRMLTEELCFDYVIRFRRNIAVTATTGETRTASAWVRPGGRARVLRRRGHRRPLCGGNHIHIHIHM